MELKTKIEILKQTLADLQVDRDAWKENAEAWREMALALGHNPENPDS